MFFLLHCSFSCTRTSIQMSQQNKTDHLDGQKTPHRDHSSINTHDQSTSFGNENFERLKKMLFTNSELQPMTIIENDKIQKQVPLKFEAKLLPFAVGKCNEFGFFLCFSLHGSSLRKFQMIIGRVSHRSIFRNMLV